ncbi:type IV conjugative transfer system protein TraL [Nitrospirillum amazonense]|uniref:type IV conjugative transfer system protein TraL n=1 Tax=Nitrospirillum amazonense TaxID=28077 RepID=UPI002412C0C1|nr:type IV conjugative transfer system protein TraL [Nitrospirillum amazonense]MDG3444531.1 type IV conjugative transfer system protein TraL [Nitrospirillum amazonense]
MSQDMEQYYIPSKLDAPWRFGPLTLDQFAGGLVGLLGGVVLMNFVGPMGFVSGLVLACGWIGFLAAVRARDGGFVIANFFYWVFPSFHKNPYFLPPSHMRNFWG